MRNLGVLQYAQFLQANTISRMAQKLGVTWPPPPPVSVRNLLRLAGDLVAKRSDVVKAPWAVLLCKFSDYSSDEPFPRSFYEKLFTVSGAGTMNMTDFFRDASQRKLDVTECAVFGWYTLDKKTTDYTERGDLITWAKEAAIKEAKDEHFLDPYAVIVICTNAWMKGDLFGNSDGYAVCNTNVNPFNGYCAASPGITGQEILHGYGLKHSRADNVNDSPKGSIGPPSYDYADAWDIMSGDKTYMAPLANMPTQDQQGHHMKFVIGPMLNAANMAAAGWLNESRVWKTVGSGPATIILRPLAYPNLPGWLAARISGIYLVEFRVREDWDAAIPGPAVLVHYFMYFNSYIVSRTNYKPVPIGFGTDHKQALVAGDVFQMGDPAGGSPWTKVEVLNIDAPSYTATVRLSADYF